MRLKRRPRQRSGIQRVPEKRFPGHRAWVRGCECAVAKTTWLLNTVRCDGPIEAAHARTGTNGGLAQKPHDKWCLPLCGAHHAHQTAIGEKDFGLRYCIDMKKIAEDLAARSPHRKGWEDA